MAAYVLVGGGWLGGWCWQRVAPRLREEGHDAYPVTLTGLGERVHLASAQVDLQTHITDVVNVIEFEDLHDVVLLGHSYAGIVVTGVADRVTRPTRSSSTPPKPPQPASSQPTSPGTVSPARNASSRGRVGWSPAYPRMRIRTSSSRAGGEWGSAQIGRAHV